MRRIRISEEALEDFADGFRFYEAQDQGSAITSPRACEPTSSRFDCSPGSTEWFIRIIVAC